MNISNNTNNTVPSVGAGLGNTPTPLASFFQRADRADQANAQNHPVQQPVRQINPQPNILNVLNIFGPGAGTS